MGCSWSQFCQYQRVSELPGTVRIPLLASSGIGMRMKSQVIFVNKLIPWGSEKSSWRV